ncbi:MAG: valyl-tRNA synthetase [Candidatus Saccharibacteria bacterium]|nr:valyl-tRNA synthetase [Candidatus Saccharibacteria bacterium]
MNLSKTYEPGEYESDIYDLWEKSGAFTPKNRGSDKTYSIVMPPPNANANMHIGYEFTAVLEDIPVRYHRMKGEAALLLPGADHAGFETQAVYEKHLAKEGKSRFDFSREELYKDIWDFVALNRDNFEAQLRTMGASVDWSRFTFTLDKKIVDRAYKTFKKMWDEKLIYRGERLVNYCTFHRTGFADIEVEYSDAVSPLYYIKYGPFELATTRPETKFGDTAVAVHPDDKRYSKWVGKTVTVEGVNGPFDVMVIADEMVDMEFGTGVVKITPAHSFDDWEVAKRHNLPVVRVIEHDGTMNEKAGKYRGMTVMEARLAVAEAMKEKGLLIKVDENYHNRVGKCYKCGTVIEPMLMQQWFVDMQPLAKRAIAALQAKKINFYPDSKRTQLITYLEGLKDWNISRQIAWGIPIPAFQNVDDSDDWIFETNTDQEIIEKNGKTYHRDPDVFDTWFSSSSWPYATLNYPSEDFDKFYPLSLMETGGDILYPWVSRMIMLGLYVTDDIPFKEVYIHGYIRAEDGTKMSKSIGNTVDNGALLKEFGSDAVRMGIIAGRSPGESASFAPGKIQAARNFCNKLWNVARYIEDVIGDDFEARKTPEVLSIADHWMLTKLQQLTERVTSDLDNYRFSEAYDSLYHTVWDDFADWYLEASKATPNPGLLAYFLENLLKLAHPFAPFVTETIWQTLKWEGDSLLITSSWPEISLAADPKKARDFETIQTMVVECRTIIANIGLSKPILGYKGSEFLEMHAGLIMRLARLGSVEKGLEANGLRLTRAPFEAWIIVDANTAQKYLSKLEEKQSAEAVSVERLKGRLSNKAYVESAPEKLVAETRAQLEESEAKLHQITTEIDSFNL